jgi:hypothetical protein
MGAVNMHAVAGIKWLAGKLARRAKDARQAEAYIRKLSPDGYPYAQRLADVHARAAEVYEAELRALGFDMGDTP